MSSYTVVSGFKFIVRFNSKSKFDGAGVGQENGSVIAGLEIRSTSTQ